MTAINWHQLLNGARSGNRQAATALIDLVLDRLCQDELFGTLTSWDPRLAEEAARAAVAAAISPNASPPQDLKALLDRGKVHAFSRTHMAAIANHSPAQASLLEFVKRALRRLRLPHSQRLREPETFDTVANDCLFELLQGSFNAAVVRRFASVLAWIKQVAQSALARQSSDTDVRTIPIASGGDCEPGGYVLQDSIPDQRSAHVDYSFPSAVQRVVDELQQIHERVRATLDEGARSQRDDYAVYLWEYRWRTLLCAKRGSQSVTPSCLDAVESLTPWTNDDSARRIRSDWPSIGQLWSELRRLLLESDPQPPLSTSLMLQALQNLAPNVRCTENTYQQWASRVRKRLKGCLHQLLRGCSPEVMDGWGTTVFGQRTWLSISRLVEHASAEGDEGA